MEHIDYFSEDYQFLGQVSIDEIHQKGLWHQTVAFWLFNKEKKVVYLQLRGPKNRVGPNTFDASSGGHLSAGETKEDGSNILLNNKEDVLKLSTDNILFKELNDGVEELIALTNLIRNNKEEFQLIRNLIGDLSELSTENKQNVMESINEVCAISQMAVSRLEYDSEAKTLKVYDYHGLNDEIVFE